MSKRYEVLKDGRPALKFAAEPGVLTSTAMPPPGFKPPAHPFLSGQALDARVEHQLAGLLGKATSVEEFIGLLEQSGYEVKPLS